MHRVFLMNLPDSEFEQLFSEDKPALVNIGCGEDLTIRELVQEIVRVTDYRGEIVWDQSKPDGTPRKLLDVNRINNLGWQAKTLLSQGLKRAYEDFLLSYQEKEIT